MKKGRKGAKSGQDEPTATDKLEDGRFDKSSVGRVNFQFKLGDPLRVRRAVLQRTPKLTNLDPTGEDGWGYTIRGRETPSLKHISRSAGHVFVSYLYTDTYSTLKWIGPTNGHNEKVVNLKTAFEVYVTAREYGLDGLEELAKEQITSLSKGVNAFTIVEIVSEAYPSSTNKDTWFPTLMKSVVKTAFETLAELLQPQARPLSGDELDGDVEIPTAKVLLKGALEVYREMVEAMTAKYVPNPLDNKVVTKADVSNLEDGGEERPTTIEETVRKGPKMEEPATPAESGIKDTTLGAISTNKEDVGQDRRIMGKRAGVEEPYAEEKPSGPESTPYQKKDDGTDTGTTTIGDPSGGGGTASTWFGTPNTTFVSDAPGTAGAAFCPTILKDLVYP
ncbi:hypothetical protein B0H63DRAFT_507257 [Podospora didyma]|uniref:Uncharacterized protein n=1 Tax=Podospora didyma TaxID=330526 RepID=A0AAE0NXV7_9PEZI|nr:hypothetical protein B0H63DRAFT_507257 [Podospora didyma]